MIKMIIAFFKSLFGIKPTPKLPETTPETAPEDDIILDGKPFPEEDPVEEPERIPDTFNDGNTREPDFAFIWDSLKLDEHRIDEINQACEKIMSNKHIYEAVEAEIGCPWWYVAALHYRESSLNFTGVLHNGERIIGTGRKTRLVPAGRGPFLTWEDAAIDVLTLKKYPSLNDWGIIECIIRGERYNGLGYRHRGEYSPYLFAGTNWHDETGKYVSDGKYKSDAPEKQLGITAIWLGLQEYYGIEID